MQTCNTADAISSAVPSSVRYPPRTAQDHSLKAPPGGDDAALEHRAAKQDVVRDETVCSVGVLAVTEPLLG